MTPPGLQRPLPRIDRPRRMAFAMALVALLAQLWLGQISAAHLARMAAAGPWSDICTAQAPVAGAGTHAEGERTPPALSALDCPVCATALASPAPPAAPPTAALAPAAAHTPAACSGAPVRALRHAGLRPPAQAPPHA